MKKLLLASLLTSLITTGAAQAATEQGIGTVDLQRAVSQCKEGEAARADLLKKSEEVNIELKVLVAEVEKLRGELTGKEAGQQDADQLTEKNRLLQKKVRELQDRQREAQADLKQVESDRVKKLLSKFGPILAKIGEDEHLSVILDRNNGVYYAGKKTDVTPMLVQRADEEYEKH
jgi:Skp family chaperone for outer membrane proteins